MTVWERVKYLHSATFRPELLICVTCGEIIPLGVLAWRKRGTQRSIHDGCPVPERNECLPSSR